MCVESITYYFQFVLFTSRVPLGEFPILSCPPLTPSSFQAIVTSPPTYNSHGPLILMDHINLHPASSFIFFDFLGLLHHHHHPNVDQPYQCFLFGKNLYSKRSLIKPTSMCLETSYRVRFTYNFSPRLYC